MPLEYTPLPVPLFAPADEGADDLAVEAPVLAKAQNVEYPLRGRPGKRPGRDRLGNFWRETSGDQTVDHGPFPAGRGLLWESEGQLWRAAQNEVYHYERATDTWVSATEEGDGGDLVPRLVPCRVDSRGGPDDRKGVQGALHASNGTYRIWVVRRPDASWFWVVEDANGAEILRGNGGGSALGAAVPVAWAGGAIGYISAETGNLNYQRIDPIAGRDTYAPVLLAANASNVATGGDFCPLDAVQITGSIWAIYAYRDNVGAPRWGRLQQDGTTDGAPVTKAASGVVTAICVGTSSDGRAGVCWGTNGGANSVQGFAYNAAYVAYGAVAVAIAPGAAPATLWRGLACAIGLYTAAGPYDLLTCVYSPGEGEVAIQTRAGFVDLLAYVLLDTHNLPFDTAVVSSIIVLDEAKLQLAVWLRDGLVSRNAAGEITSSPGQLVLYEFPEDTVLARANVDLAATALVWPLVARVSPDGELATIRQSSLGLTSLSLLRWGQADQETVTTAPTRRAVVIGGGVVSYCDGRSVSELGVLRVMPAPTGVAAGAGGLGAGTYSYNYTVEVTDALGLLHRSAFAAELVQVVAAGNKVTLTLRTLQLSNRHGEPLNAIVRVWRSLANAPTTDTRRFLVSGIDPADVAGDNCWIWNDPSSRTVTFVDALTDAALVTRPQVTIPVIAPQAPYPSAQVLEAKGRLWAAVNGDIPTRVQYSKLLEPYQAAEFSQRLFVDLDADCTGIALLGDAVLAFTAQRAFAITGDGLSNDGTGLPFNISVLTHEAGCTSTRSIVTTPLGVMYQGPAGIRMLSGNGQVSEVGEPVKRYGSDAIRAAVLVAAKRQVRFVQEERTLVFDYAHNLWSVWTFGARHAATLGGAFVSLGDDGVVRLESETSWRDDGDAIYQMVMASGWISAPGAAWMRARRLVIRGRYYAPHVLRVEIAYNGQDAWEEVVEWDAGAAMVPDGSGVWGPETEAQYELAVRLPARRCSRFRVRITEVQYDDWTDKAEGTGQAGRSCDLLGLWVDVARKMGLPQLGSGRNA